MNLNDKVAIVTGAGGGIGQATAIRFAKAGAKLVLVDINEDAIEATIQKLEGITSDFLVVKTDVSKSNEVEKYVQQALEKYRKIDVFFNNAGVEGPAATPTVEYSEDDFDHVIAVNTKGVFLGLKYVLKAMKQHKSGSIINTSSIMGLTGRGNVSAYVASKHSIIGLTKTAAVENAALNIRVNAICPGPIETDMVRHAAEQNNPNNPQEYYQKVIERVPAKRYGKPEEVANLVTFLASDEASFITGATITIDGGMMATYA